MLPVVAAAVAVGAMAIEGFPGEALLAVAVPAVSAAVVYGLFHAIRLWWAWFKAPMRLLTAEVHAIRDHQQEAHGASAPAPPPPVVKPLSKTLVLRNQIRYGRELLNNGYGPREQRQWLDGVIAALGHDIPDELEGVLIHQDLQQQIMALEAIAARQTPRRTTAVIR